jgi:hypothetical protein
MAIVLTIPCDGHQHRIELHNDGTAVMLDHDEELVRSFVAFNAEPPACLVAMDEARNTPVNFTLDHVAVTDKVRGLLACDFAEHVLHVFEWRYPNDKRPRRAIEVARAYWDEEATAEQVKKARKAAMYATRAARDAADAAGDAAAAAAAAAAAWAAKEVAWEAAEAAEYAAMYAGRDAAGDAAGYAAWEAAGDAAMALERLWQLKHTFKVLAAFEEGRPWPALS